MNDSTLVQLQAIVERAIKPVRASRSCKRNMREELLAHLIAVFEEEAARLGDERLALEKTEQRFGSSDELTNQLQESITPTGRLGWIVDHVWCRLTGGMIVNRNRLYNAICILLLLYTLIGVALLAAVMALPPDIRPPMQVPHWSLPYLAFINGFYLIAMSATLLFRLVRPPVGKRLTRAMNLLLLIAPPFGTALGIYGLWKVDRNVDLRSVGPERSSPCA
jgi:hypothetical protein